jgi:hypothetical protein
MRAWTAEGPPVAWSGRRTPAQARPAGARRAGPARAVRRAAAARAVRPAAAGAMRPALEGRPAPPAQAEATRPRARTPARATTAGRTPGPRFHAARINPMAAGTGTARPLPARSASAASSIATMRSATTSRALTARGSPPACAWTADTSTATARRMATGPFGIWGAIPSDARAHDAADLSDARRPSIAAAPERARALSRRLTRAWRSRGRPAPRASACGASPSGAARCPSSRGSGCGGSTCGTVAPR